MGGDNGQTAAVYGNFRSWQAVVFPLAVVGVGVVWSMGLLVILGYKITLLTALIPNLIVIIGIPNCVYLVNKYHGEYRKHGNKVRITAQLVHAADDFQVWSETYHREIADVFQIQDEIASMISNKLKASFIKNLVIPDQRDFETPIDHDAPAHFKKGTYYWKQMQPGYLDQSLSQFKKALETDASFFPAWPSMAMGYAFKAFHNQSIPLQAAQCCKDALDESLRINPDHSRTQSVWALYHMFFTWDWKLVAQHLNQSLSHQDSDQFFYHASLLQTAGMYQVSIRQFDGAISQYKKALKMDPLNPAVQLELARAHAYKGDHGKAIEVLKSISAQKPDFIPALEAKGWSLFSMGRQREGIEAFEAARAEATLPTTAMAGLAYAYARTSQSRLAEETKQLLVSYYQDLPQQLPYHDLAIAHLGALEYEEMFEQLNKAVDAHMPVLLFFDVNPIWDEIKRFPAFQKLQQRIYGTDQRPPL